jgi:hypothetical protein
MNTNEEDQIIAVKSPSVMARRRLDFNQFPSDSSFGVTWKNRGPGGTFAIENTKNSIIPQND